MPASLNTSTTLSEVFSVIEDSVPRKVIARIADVEERTAGHWRHGRSLPSLDAFERLLACDIEALAVPLHQYIIRRSQFRRLVPLDAASAGNVSTAAANVVKESAEFFLAAQTGMPLPVLEKEGNDIVRKVTETLGAKRAERPTPLVRTHA